MERRNGYVQNRSTVYPDGTVQRPRPTQARQSAAPPSPKARTVMGARPAQAPRQAQKSAAPARQAAPQNRRPAPPRQQASQPRTGTAQKRPANAAPMQKGAPKQQQSRKAPPKNTKNVKNTRSPQQSNKQRARENNGWIIPEGSAIYTSQGRMYEPSRSAGSQPKQPSGSGTAKSRPRNTAPSQRKSKKRKNTGAKILFWMRAFAVRLLIFFVITALLGLWWYRSEFYSNVGESGSKVTYSVDNGSKVSVTAGASSAWNSGVMYVNISALYPQMGMAAVGSLDSMRFIIKLDGVRDSSGNGSEEYVIFTDGSRTANINGSAVVMESRCRVIGEDIWIPLSFIENYMDGVDVDHTSDDSVIFTSPEYLEAQKANKESKKPKKLNAADYPIEPRFRLKRSDMLAAVTPTE